jgi:hypothetical protein
VLKKEVWIRVLKSRQQQAFGVVGIGGIYDFETATAPDESTYPEGYKLLVRQESGGKKYVRYLDGADLATIITDGTVGFPHYDLGSLEWGLSGHLTGGSDTPEPDEDGLEWIAGFGKVATVSDQPVKVDAEGLAGALLHEKLKDILDKTVGDDHAGTRTAASAFETDGHPYIHANGDEERNSMTDTAYIGDQGGVKSISASLRQLFSDATTVAVADGAPETICRTAASDIEINHCLRNARDSKPSCRPAVEDDRVPPGPKQCSAADFTTPTGVSV